MPHALITGASLGLGRALALELASRGWDLTIDARHAEPLASTAQALSELKSVRAVVGDIGDPRHRQKLVAAAAGVGKLDLLVNN
ncbi:MAG TPA: SDR family NAD(P)-dependent oxidoreductase, partial [Propionibacteriaceae bacterium]|nr:SDR family NAD(P)-dependent oxidoreductase [Propionibacteriaceae bacterium]